MRASALRRIAEPSTLRAVFRADNLWGLAALLWLATGVPRAFFGLEKGTAYYLDSTAFLIKMGLFVTIGALEVLPMVTLMAWRRAVRGGQPVDTSRAPMVARISTVQAALVVLMVFAAAAMARGVGF